MALWTNSGVMAASSNLSSVPGWGCSWLWPGHARDSVLHRHDPAAEVQGGTGTPCCIQTGWKKAPRGAFPAPKALAVCELPKWQSQAPGNGAFSPAPAQSPAQMLAAAKEVPGQRDPWPEKPWIPPRGWYLGVQPCWWQEQWRVLFFQLLSASNWVQTNRVPVKLVPVKRLRVAQHPSEQLCMEGRERATSEHHLLFLHSRLLLPHPCLESKGHMCVCGHSSGGLGSWMSLMQAGRTQRGSKKPISGTRRMRARSPTGLTWVPALPFRPAQESSEHPGAAVAMRPREAKGQQRRAAPGQRS